MVQDSIAMNAKTGGLIQMNMIIMTMNRITVSLR